MDSLRILGLQRAEFQKSENLEICSRSLQFAIVVAAIVALLIENETVIYVFSSISVFLSLVCQVLSYMAANSHSIAERARRYVTLSNGLGTQISGKCFSDMLMAFTVKEEAGKLHEDEKYFDTTLPSGPIKLAKIIEESSFWSKHLYAICSRNYWLFFIGILMLSVASLFALPIIEANNYGIIISKTVCLLLTWLVAGYLLNTALAFTKSHGAMDDIEGRLDGLIDRELALNDILVIYGDYNAVVEKTPIIPTRVYRRNKAKFNALWQERQNTRQQAPKISE